MRSSFILISILLLTNCTSDNNSKAPKNKAIIPNGTATNHSSDNETDKSIYVLKQNDTLYYKKGDSILLKHSYLL